MSRTATHTVDVAKPTGFALFCVVQSTSPIDGNVTLLAVEASCALHGTTSADTTEFEQAVKHRTIITDVVLSLLAHVAVHVVWGDSPEEIDVLVCVELGHLVYHGWLGPLRQNRISLLSLRGHFDSMVRGLRSRETATDVDFEVFVDIVVHDQAVCQSNSVWLHGVTSDICIVANIRVVKVGNLLLARAQLREQGPRPIDSSWVGRHTGAAGRTALRDPGTVGVVEYLVWLLENS